MNKMAGDDPPYLSVGTAVSAKYKGAFCEAKVSKVVRLVKCKVTYKMGLGTATVSDEYVKGALRAGQLVQIKHPDKKDLVEATITKIQDCSQYTVVFDDGDITTLRRTALCLKSGRHFNESETLDQLPLTHPEHFGNPVVGGRRGRRTRHLKEDSSEGEAEEENEPDLEQYILEVGRVVCIEASDKKKNKDNWFPGLVVMPSAQPTVRINVKDEFLVRSFKDGRYYTVPQKEISEFTREQGTKAESSVLTEAVDKALKYLDSNELPAHWERSILFSNSHQANSSDSDDNMSESSEDETPEEKDHFVAQLYKFMDDSNTPLNKSPTIAGRDVDLHRLFRVVSKFGGYNRVTNKNKWRSVTTRIKLPNNLSVHSQVKQVYRKCLHSYEAFHRTLGVTMHNHPRGVKKSSRGRSLIRDKDRSTPVNSPRPDKDEEGLSTTPTLTPPVDKLQEDKPIDTPPIERPKGPKKYEFKPRLDDEKKKKELPESDTNSSDATDLSEAPSTSRPRRIEMKVSRDQKKEMKPKPVPMIEKVKVEKFDEPIKGEEEEKVQQTRATSKALNVKVAKDEKVEKKIKEEPKTPPKEIPIKTIKNVAKKEGEEKKRGRKKLNPEDKTSLSDSSTTDSSTTTTTPTATTSTSPVNIGDKLKVFYGPANDSKVTYEAKVIDIDRDGTDLMYKVHYAGWNSRYDEWISPTRIAENLSAATKAKRLKQGNVGTPKTPATSKGRRGWAASAGKSAQDTSRSTTPCSVTSTSSRTKSPGTPATRSSRAARQEANKNARASSAIAGEHTESESDGSEESDFDTIRTRSGGKSEDGELPPRTYRRKVTKPNFGQKLERKKEKEEDDAEKGEETNERSKRARKSKSETKEGESDEDNGSPPKGRDFDLNQIRNELKGFGKPVKTSASESGGEKENISSDESTNDGKIKSEPEETVDKSKEKEVVASSSDDIYEFKEPEPFEFETRPKITDEKLKKRLVPRFFDELEKSPKRKAPKEETEVDKRRLRRTPVKKQEQEDDKEEISKKTSVDPFDELVESPSFHSGKVKNAGLLPDPKSKVPKALNLDDTSSNSNEEESDKMDIDETTETSEKQEDVNLFSDPCALDEQVKSVEEEPKATPPKPIFSDDDTNDALVINAFTEPQTDKSEVEKPSTSSAMNMDDSEDDMKLSEIKLNQDASMKITPALQETSVLMEAIKAPAPILLTKLEEPVDITTKPTAKIADSILQKLSTIDKSPENAEIDVVKPDEDSSAIKPKSPEKPKKIKSDLKPKQKELSPDVKKRSRKIVSREFIESESDSSDCEERLVIARSDDESQPNTSDKSDIKTEPKTDVKLEPITIPEPQLDRKEIKHELDVEPKEEDSYLHSLLCEETIPGSPTPCTETTEAKPKEKSSLEMPFASAPGSSNGNGGIKRVDPVRDNKVVKEAQIRTPPMEVHERERREVPTVLDNTPPTTPESTLSNLSPRGDPGGLSPNTVDNDSCRSLEADVDFHPQRGSTAKLSTFSEEDSLLNIEGTSAKKQEIVVPSMCRKRRKSCKGADDTPVKRGRKPLNRSRHNSDSDDTSEHSMQGLGIGSSNNMERIMRSPRPSKYNFYVELDPTLDSGQRIAILQQKLQDIRKTYAEVKAELAIVERRRKKIRRREREAKMAAKQESVAA